MSERCSTGLYYDQPPLGGAGCCGAGGGGGEGGVGWLEPGEGMDTPGAEAAGGAEDGGAGRGSLRRLGVALGLAIVLAFLCWVLAPRWGVHLPMIVPLMGFAAIAAGTLMAAAEGEVGGEGSKRKGRGDAPGRPMCCAGPRPVGERLRMMKDEG